VKPKSAKSSIKTTARQPAPHRRQGQKRSRNDHPKAAVDGPPRAAALRLVAEVERLAAELAASRQRISELEARVDVDPLTETLNRRGFERELKRSLAYVKRYGASAALIYLDLDGFKPVNDRHGHAAGDAALKAIAAALARRIRASDVVARIGGDEFVVLLWNLSEADVVAKAAELETTVYATPVRWGASTLVIGASAGAAFIGPLDTPAEVLARADAAMYLRKAQKNASSRTRREAAVRR